MFDQLVASWILTGRIELRDAPFVVTYLTDPFLAGSGVTSANDMECDLAIPIL
jgi:hypothetical protein